MKAELLWPQTAFRAQSLPLAPAQPKGSEAIRDYGYPFFLCLFSWQIFSHTKRTKWNASPVPERTLLAPLPPCGLPLSGRVPFISSQYPKELTVIKTINAAFLCPFLLVDNYDNWIQRQLHRRISSLHSPQNVISIFCAENNTFSLEITVAADPIMVNVHMWARVLERERALNAVEE